MNEVYIVISIIVGVLSILLTIVGLVKWSTKHLISVIQTSIRASLKKELYEEVKKNVVAEVSTNIQKNFSDFNIQFNHIFDELSEIKAIIYKNNTHAIGGDLENIFLQIDKSIQNGKPEEITQAEINRMKSLLIFYTKNNGNGELQVKVESLIKRLENECK